MASELSGIFRIKIVPEDLTPSCFCSMMSLFEETHTFFLVNRAFPFVGPRGPISCSKLQKYFMHMRVKMYAEFDDDIQMFSFGLEIPFLVKFCLKS